MLKSHYEISIWNDTFQKAVLDKEGNIVTNSFYKEELVAIIGSDTMTAPNRAISPKLTKSINGFYSLSFTLYTRYYDEESSEFIDNPFTKFLVNERKIKLKYKEKWYDFVIKNVEEDSLEHSYHYTAESLYINELSTNGLSITFDKDLENNIGTVEELAAEAIKETDWQIAEDSEIIQEKQEEPLFVLTTKEPISAFNIETNEEIDVPAGKDLLVFYSCLNSLDPYFQFLYNADGIYTINDAYLVSNAPVYYKNGVEYINGAPSFVKEIPSVPSSYRGEKFIRNPILKKDSLTGKMITIYTDTEDQQDVYISSETEYITPTTVKNYVTNPKEFIGNDGWLSDAEKEPFPNFYPPLDYSLPLEPQLATSKAFLKVKLNKGQSLWNSGIIDSRVSFVKNGIALNEEYSLKIKHFYLERDNLKQCGAGQLSCFVAFYTLKDNKIKIGKKIFSFDIFKETTDNFLISNAKAQQAVTYRDLLHNPVGIFFQSMIDLSVTYYFEDIQFFKYQEQNGKQIFPDSVPESGYFSVYTGYKPNIAENKNLLNKEDISYCYSGNKIPQNYQIKYDDKFEKKRTIEISKSNIFNILQELCEKFECWVEFEVSHNQETGEILRDNTGRQIKKIRFKKYITKDNYTGFKYGINLKGIKRTIDSDEIVSKIVVEDNSNEFAKDGFCTIARAKDNPSGETFLYNFKHYYTQGLLDYNEVNNDLYSPTQSMGYLAYYPRIKAKNIDRTELLEKISSLSLSINNLKAFSQTYGLIVQESKEQLLQANQELNQYHEGFTYDSYLKTEENMSQEKKDQADRYRELDPMITELVATITVLNQKVKSYEGIATQYSLALEKAEKEYRDMNLLLEQNLEDKKAINKEFYTKYSRFIQEGSWIGEDYLDDNLYYYDAQGTLNTSADPLITYDIQVIEVSQIEGLEGYTFEVGDITTMEDTEFFGWTIIDGIKTPIQQQIIISEVSYDLDNAENNHITVQNYKTRFEDLFQRISATTATLQYKEGTYNRAAGVITPSGQIDHEALQNSLAQNSFVLVNSTDQSVIWNENGITVTSPKTPNSVVRIINGGIYLSKDGGSNWSSAITGYGINANYLTAGQIDTSLIRIMNSGFPTFRWDSRGISAYSFSFLEGTDKLAAINSDTFIRFDQYGLYGIENNDSVVTSLDDILNKASFGLTWKGFFLKNRTYTKEGAIYGSVEISKENDFQIKQGQVERIKIGNLNDLTSSELPNYGIRINDENGKSVLETDSSGKLWLKDKLNISSTSTNENKKNYNISLGALEKIKDGTTDIHETFNVNDKFIVYEDGSLEAKEGNFTGIINAIGGKIGNLNIEELNNNLEVAKRIYLSSTKGTTIKIDSNGNAFPSNTKIVIEYNGLTPSPKAMYQWEESYNLSQWIRLPASDTEYNLNLQEKIAKIPEGIYGIRVTYYDETQEGQKNEYTASIIFTFIKDGTSPITVMVDAQKGNFYINNNIETVLEAHIYKGNVEITNSCLPEDFVWEKYDENGTLDQEWTKNHANSGKSVTITNTQVLRKAKFICYLKG